MTQYLTENSKIFDNGFGDNDYWLIADVIKDIYLSDGSMATIMDFERVLDDLDMYAYKNWAYGELVEGPDIGRYTVTCVFMWPYKLMPDPRAARRLTSLDCQVEYKQTTMEMPVKITNPGDFRPGTHKAKLEVADIWLVKIVMPKDLMDDIRTGSLELEDQTIDLEELDSAYDEDLDQDANKTGEQGGQSLAPQNPFGAPGSLPPAPGGLGAPPVPGPGGF
jgi:hypothetical protein